MLADGAASLLWRPGPECTPYPWRPARRWVRDRIHPASTADLSAHEEPRFPRRRSIIDPDRFSGKPTTAAAAAASRGCGLCGGRIRCCCGAAGSGEASTAAAAPTAATVGGAHIFARVPRLPSRQQQLERAGCDGRAGVLSGSSFGGHAGRGASRSGGQRK